ncbi:MAG: hypothetical protein AAFU79_28220 [Myxococcota bacterium]
MGPWVAAVLTLLSGEPYEDPAELGLRRRSVPAVDVELFFGLGVDTPLESSRAAFGERGGPETQTSLALSQGVGVYFPEAWLALHFLFTGSIGTLRQDLFQETDAPELQGGGRIGLGLGLELRPSREGFVPFGRIFGGYATLFSNGVEPNDCAARRRAAGLDPARCVERPIDRVGFEGYHLGLGAGIAYQGILERPGRQAAVALEARYQMSEWGNVFIERADGTRVETASFLDERGAVSIGDGPDVLHQLVVLIGVRFGLVPWLVARR